MWNEETFYRGGGDVPYQDRRVYRYRFKDKWTRVFTPYRVELNLPFSTIELNTRGCILGHNAVLKNPDFCIRGSNVMEWVRSMTITGKVEFTFIVDAGDPFDDVLRKLPPKCVLRAKFSNKGLASLFKLTFG
jgi:hypothetical protein